MDNINQNKNPLKEGAEVFGFKGFLGFACKLPVASKNTPKNQFLPGNHPILQISF